VDYTHPALGGCFGPECRVAYGYDFVGDAYTGDNVPIPDDDPRDNCNGHGTHVAGIIGAKDLQFTGVAPEGKTRGNNEHYNNTFFSSLKSHLWCL
jgi:subtilisin family serine protease